MVLSEIQNERYARHYVLDEIGLEGQKKLLNSKVLVIGAGGLGSISLMYLAAAGIGTIGIVDFDKVELSNLHRQIIHKTSNIGIEKTISAKKAIEEINSDVKVIIHNEYIKHENILDIIKPYDFVIEAVDRFQTKFLINDACVMGKKPYSHAGIIRFNGQVMTYVPNKGPCLRCILENMPQVNVPTCKQIGVIGPAIGVIANIQALEAIKYVLQKGELLTGKILQFDGLKMSFKTLNFSNPSPNCKICSNNAVGALSELSEEYKINL